MHISATRSSDLIWVSKDVNGKKWFESTISLFDFSPLKTTDAEKSKFLTQVLKNAVRLNSEFLDKWNGFKIETFLEFPLEWGLGSSSTLLCNVAEWADCNPFLLHFKVSNGSGYDIACAGASGPVQYALKGDELSYTEIDFSPSFANKLYFVYLGHKQNSALAVEEYLKNVKSRASLAKSLDKIVNDIIHCNTLSSFESLIDQHEQILSKALQKPTIKSERFSDYWGSVKSLGAWGGDFVLATSDKSKEETTAYFKSRNCETVIPYKDIILEG